ncbi:TRAP transporter large permease subunit [Ammoniphilus sp. CFH 90114]|nr:TRAP transporter large permease subunit [Ammoniphilus sp. CFH 90114]
MALSALLVFIGFITCWNVILKRNIGEAMLLGFVITSLFGGVHAPRLMWDGLVFAATYEVMYAAIAFVFMAYLIDKAEILKGLMVILHAFLGRVPGGAAYIDTLTSAFMGSLSGSNSGNTAATGTFTAHWMIKSNWRRELAATVVAGNGGLGAALPPSSSMFIMLGFAPVAALVSESALWMAMLTAGIYQVLYRIGLIMYLVRKQKIISIPIDEALPFKEAIKVGGKYTLVFWGAIIPIVMTVGPVAEIIEVNIGEEAANEISLITWIPIFIISISLMVGWSKLPKNAMAWSKFLQDAIPRYSVIGAILLFAFAQSHVLSQLGLAEDLNQIIGMLEVPKWLMVLVVGLLVTLVAGPLSSTATVTAIGMVSFAALASVDVHPVAAVVAILTFASTEGSSPPASGSIFIASGLAEVQPEKTFIPLITYYVIPIVVIGWLIGMGLLPLPF